VGVAHRAMSSPGALSWVAMMAGMMLPSAVPAATRSARAAPFLAAYVAVWAAVGLAVFAVYRPQASVVAGVVTVAAGLYELTRFKRACRVACQGRVRSGWMLGGACLGSNLGLMAMFVALGVMSLWWMALVAVVVLVQKLVSPRAAIDVPLALAIVVLGVIVAV
jgi:predicted metal-binding membrane protein